MASAEPSNSPIGARIIASAERLLSELELDKAELAADYPLFRLKNADEGRAAVDDVIGAVRRVRDAAGGS